MEFGNKMVNLGAYGRRQMVLFENSLFSSCMMVVVIMLQMTIVHPCAFAGDVHGVLQVVKGDVQIKSSKDGQLIKAKVGSKIFPKDAVITGKDSRAKIVMVDHNILNISPESQVVIQNYEYAPEQGKKDVLLDVLYGKIRSKVEQKYDGKSTKFQVKTPTAVAGVRGTDFLASFSKESSVSQVVTFHGEVAVGQPGPGGSMLHVVSVTPGQFTQITGSSPPQSPQAMPPQQLAHLDRETQAEGLSSTPPKGQSDSSANGPKDKEDKNKEDKKGGIKEDQKKPEGDGKSDGKKVEGRSSSSGASSGENSYGGRGPGSVAAKDESSSPSPTSSPSSVGATPAPVAGVAGGGGMSMLRPEDFAGAPTSTVMIPNMGPALMPPQPLVPNLTAPLPVCDFCNQVIQNGQSTVLLRVTH